MSPHLRDETLLELADGAPVDAAARAHLDACAECAHALAEVVGVGRTLRATPLLEPPAELLGQLPPGRRSRRRRAALVLVPLAAALAALGGVLAMRDGGGPSQEAQSLRSAAPGAAVAPQLAAVVVARVSGPPEAVAAVLRERGLSARVARGVVVVAGADAARVRRALGQRAPGPVQVRLG